MTKMRLPVVIFFVFLSSMTSAQLVINELAVENNTHPDESGQYHPWIEIANTSSKSQPLNGWRFSLETQPSISNSEHCIYRLPDLEIAPFQVLLVWLSGEDRVSEKNIHSSFKLNSNTVHLINDNLGIVESFSFKLAEGKFESVGRFPDGSENVIFFPKNLTSPGFENIYSSHWQKAVSKSMFPPGDSAPNASVVLNDTIYILGGWRVHTSSSSYVWKSANGIEWEEVNNSPPYNPYSSFVTFNDHIWALGPESFYSRNGIEWVKVEVATPFPVSSYLNEGIRTCVFKDEIWAFYENKIWSTSDGINWILITDNTLWEPRYNQQVLVFKDRLWHMGGGIGYKTGSDYYYNDIWSSGDGKEWKLETNNAPWNGRYWFNAHTYNNHIVLFGGWNYHQQHNGYQGNLNDFWVSKDGLEWKLIVFDNIWEPRHASYCFFFNNTIWISSGYGTQGETTLYNDMWKLVNPDSELTLSLPNKLVYGDSDINVKIQSNCGGEIELTNLNETVLEIQGSKLYAIAAGLSQLKIVQKSDSIFCNPKEVRYTFPIDKKLLSVVADSKQKNLGEDNPPLSISYSGFLLDDTIDSIDLLPEVSTDATFFSDEGEYPIFFTREGADNKYDLVTKQGLLSILNKDDSKLIIFPNPAESFVSIHLRDPSEARLSIYDSKGAKMVQTQINHSINVDVSFLIPGMYVCLIHHVNTTEVTYGKFIKN